MNLHVYSKACVSKTLSLPLSLFLFVSLCLSLTPSSASPSISVLFLRPAGHSDIHTA